MGDGSGKYGTSCVIFCNDFDNGQNHLIMVTVFIVNKVVILVQIILWNI